MTSLCSAANQRAVRSSRRSPPCVRGAGVHLLVCMCVSVRVCASECEQVDIVCVFFFNLSETSLNGALEVSRARGERAVFRSRPTKRNRLCATTGTLMKSKITSLLRTASDNKPHLRSFTSFGVSFLWHQQLTWSSRATLRLLALSLFVLFCLFVVSSPSSVPSPV